MRPRASSLVCIFVLMAVVALPQGAADATDATGYPAPDSLWTPPACTGLFADVPCSGTGSQFAAWIEQFSRDGITSGCSAGVYCPDSVVTRRQMAVFVERAMRGSASWPPHTALVFHRAAAEAGSDLSSGADLLAIVAAIPTSGSEAPSAANPWLVKVGPGIYGLGASSLTLPAYTALEGAGQGVTMITATGYSDQDHGTVIAGNQGRLSRLTIANTGGSTYEIAVKIGATASSVSFEHVTLAASNPSNSSGSAIAVDADAGASFTMVESEVTAHSAYINRGIWVRSNTVESRLDAVKIDVYGTHATGDVVGISSNSATQVISNSRISASAPQSATGVSAIGGTLQVRNSTVWTSGTATTAVVVGGAVATLQGVSLTGFYWLSNSLSGTVTVGASNLQGSTNNSSGTVTCLGNYTASAFLSNTCP